jgi:putative protein kinase ArgK-like GTPase of G3E family
MSQSDHTELLSQVRDGDRQALAKAITVIENTGRAFEIENKKTFQKTLHSNHMGQKKI